MSGPDLGRLGALGRGATIVGDARRIGSERCTRLVLADGRLAMLAELLPEFAADESVHRRYTRDLERRRGLEVEGLVPILAGSGIGDAAGDGSTPWRLRGHPGSAWPDEFDGDTLQAWLDRRAPAPIDEVTQLIARLCDVVDRVHRRGVAIRDLGPRRIVLVDGTEPWLADIGLARVDVLSTRTAASLVVAGSPYLAPETLRRTIVDQRADVFGLGVLVFHALTGVPPWDERSSLLRPPGPPPRAADLRAEIPAALDELIARCMADDPDHRPPSASVVGAALRGESAFDGAGDGRLACQSCGAPMRVGQRLCLACGKQTVQFLHAEEDAPREQRWRVVLKKAKEGAEFGTALREVLGAVSSEELPPLNFLIGDQRLYSSEEQKRLIHLPVTLYTDVTHESALALKELLLDAKIEVVVQPVEAWELDRASVKELSRAQKRAVGIVGAGALTAAAVAGAAAGAMGLAIAGTAGVLVLGIVWASMRAHNTKRLSKPRSLLALRRQPAALPASDPFVARLAEAMDGAAPDLRERVGEFALLAQRLVDHRAEHAGARAEIDLVTAPVAELVDRIVVQVAVIRQIDAGLADLDEGVLVRALAASEARGEGAVARTPLLEGLDRLRSLEESRAAGFHRLLEAGELLGRAAAMGLEIHDEEGEHARLVARALATLEEG